jgi:hypothetical protein
MSTPEDAMALLEEAHEARRTWLAFEMEGAVPLDTFGRMCINMNKLLVAVGKQTAPRAKLRWLVGDLHHRKLEPAGHWMRVEVFADESPDWDRELERIATIAANLAQRGLE